MCGGVNGGKYVITEEEGVVWVVWVVGVVGVKIFELRKHRRRNGN